MGSHVLVASEEKGKDGEQLLRVCVNMFVYLQPCVIKSYTTNLHWQIDIGL